MTGLLVFWGYMEIKFLQEHQLTPDVQNHVATLLQLSFTDIDYQGRTYFKQLPYARLLAYHDDQLVGHLALDYRVMSLNGQAINVLGVVDLCVAASYQRQGIGLQLLDQFEDFAHQAAQSIDFLFLVADDTRLYERAGYQTTSLETTWLKIDNHKTYGAGTERIIDTNFMYKSISGISWTHGSLDLLGFMY